MIKDAHDKKKERSWCEAQGVWSTNGNIWKVGQWKKNENKYTYIFIFLFIFHFWEDTLYTKYPIGS